MLSDRYINILGLDILLQKQHSTNILFLLRPPLMAYCLARLEKVGVPTCFHHAI